MAELAKANYFAQTVNNLSACEFLISSFPQETTTNSGLLVRTRELIRVVGRVPVSSFREMLEKAKQPEHKDPTSEALPVTAEVALGHLATFLDTHEAHPNTSSVVKDLPEDIVSAYGLLGIASITPDTTTWGGNYL